MGLFKYGEFIQSLNKLVFNVEKIMPLHSERIQEGWQRGQLPPQNRITKGNIMVNVN